MTDPKPFTVTEAVRFIETPSNPLIDGEAILLPLTSAIPGTFEPTDTLGQFVLRVDPEGNEERRTTRFVVRIERMD